MRVSADAGMPYDWIMKRLTLALMAVTAIVGAAAVYVHLAGIPKYPPRDVPFTVHATPDAIARGRRAAMMLCVSCHKDPRTGALTGRRMEDLPAMFGEVYSSNITQDRTYGIGAWTDGEIAYLVRTGVSRDGRYIPPWMTRLPHLADD